MALSQKEVIAGSLAGASLFFHLLSAGNFIPTSEMGFIGYKLSYIHVLCNLTGIVIALSVFLSL